jgi:hypothetical protein
MTALYPRSTRHSATVALMAIASSDAARNTEAALPSDGQFGPQGAGGRLE